MSVVRRIAIGQNHKSAEVLNQATDDIQTLSGLTLGATFPGFVNYPTLTGEVGVTSNLYPVGDVRRHGVPTNGTSDATTALQNGLDSVSALGGGVLFVPAGTYKYTKLSVAANVTLRGAGRGATTFVRSALGSEGNNLKLFGIRLTGAFARLERCSLRGLWNPATPTMQTFDINVAPVGDNVQRTTIEDVETCNAHIGYNVGGVIGDPVASWGGQSFNSAVRCYAHDTYDLGFALVAKDRTDSGTAIGCSIENCVQESSYAQAGLEIRYQRAARVLGFNTRNNTDSAGGAGIRLEETAYAQIDNVQVSSCQMSVQVIHDSYQCWISGVTTRRCVFGAYLLSSADIHFTDITFDQCSRDAVYLGYVDGGSWTRNNERVSIDGFEISEPGFSFFANGISVQGTGAVEAALSHNGTGLSLRNGIVRRAWAKGISIQAGGNFRISDVVLEDNGIGSGVVDGTGIFVDYPAPNGVTDSTAVTGGYITDVSFVTTGSMPRSLNDNTGSTGLRNTMLGVLQYIGSFTQYADNPHLGGVNAPLELNYTADQPEGMILRQRTTALRSPRLMLVNSADGTGGAIVASGNTLEFNTGAVPGTTSGTRRMTLIASALSMDAGTGIAPGAGSTLKKILTGSGTYDPPSLVTGAQTTTTVAVTGAALGDMVTVSFGPSLSGMQLTGYVSAADTVTVVLQNGTGGTLDLASGTLRATVWQF